MLFRNLWRRRKRESMDRLVYRRIYRTEDGRLYFKFSFETQNDGKYRVYVDEGPLYSAYRRDDSLAATHRLRDGARTHVCWSDPLSTFEAAKTVAKFWAEKTALYLKTGKRF